MDIIVDTWKKRYLINKMKRLNSCCFVFEREKKNTRIFFIEEKEKRKKNQACPFHEDIL